jgi:DMSO reductase anchor subunit
MGVFCSVLIYHATRRPWWSASATGFKFFMTTAILGLATTAVTFSFGAAVPLVRTLSMVIAAASITKALGELSAFSHLRDKRQTDLKRSALLMTTDLATWSLGRFGALVVGGIALPLVNASGDGSPWLATVSLAFLVVGELLERILFFAASTSQGMPGGVR